MPFVDLSSFWAWVISNLLWTVVQSTIISGTIIMTSKLGFQASWKKSGWLAFSVFMMSLTVLSALRSTSPYAYLTPRILSEAYGGKYNGIDNDNVVMFIDVRNSGNVAAAIIDIQYSVQVNGSTHHGKQMMLPNSITLHDVTGKSVAYANSDALYNKTSHKIDPGDLITGISIVHFDDIGAKELQFGNAIITFEETDTFGHKSFATAELRKLPPGELEMFPGLHPIN